MNTTASTTHAQAKNLYVRNAGSRKKATSPAIHTGASIGLISRNWNGTTAHRGSRARGPARRDLARDVDLRPVVVRLPQDPGHPQHERDRGAAPDVGVAQQAPRPRDRDSGEQADGEERRQRLVQQSRRPSTTPATSQSRSSRVRSARTTSHVTAVHDQQVERRRAEQVAGEQHDHPDGRTARGDQLGAPRPAELAREQAGREDTISPAAIADGSRSTVSELGRDLASSRGRSAA